MAFSDFTKKIGSSIKKAGDKLDNTVDIQKIKYKIGKKQEEADKICLDLGKTILTSDNIVVEDEISKAKALLTAVELEIEALDKERIAKENKAICTGCGAEVDIKNDFCPKCGKKIERPEPEATAEGDNTTEEKPE